MTLDTVCVSDCKEGVGTEVKHAAVVSFEHEDILWKKGVLGVASTKSLTVKSELGMVILFQNLTVIVLMNTHLQLMMTPSVN